MPTSPIPTIQLSAKALTNVLMKRGLSFGAATLAASRIARRCEAQRAESSGQPPALLTEAELRHSLLQSGVSVMTAPSIARSLVAMRDDPAIANNAEVATTALMSKFHVGSADARKLADLAGLGNGSSPAATKDLPVVDFKVKMPSDTTALSIVDGRVVPVVELEGPAPPPADDLGVRKLARRLMRERGISFEMAQRMANSHIRAMREGKGGSR